MSVFTTESSFYYGVTLWRDTASLSINAPWVSALPASTKVRENVVVLNPSEGQQEQGMYLYDGNTWRLVLPYVEVANAIVMGATINLFYAMVTPYTQLPTDSIIYRNSFEYSAVDTTITPGNGYVWAALTNTNIKTIDSQYPDANGNVLIRASDATNVGSSLIADSGATTGNILLKPIQASTGINVSASATDVIIKNTGVVTINGVAADGTGNYVLPAATTTSEGVVQVGSGLNVSAGVISVDTSHVVTSVNGELPSPTGAVTVQIADIPNLQSTLATFGTVKTVDSVSPDVNGNVNVPLATSTTVGTVKVPTTGGLSIDASGNITINQASLPVYVSQINSDATSGGLTLVEDNGATSHIPVLKQIVAGANITLSSDAHSITINATTSGGAGGLSAVQSVGAGTSIVYSDGSSTGIAQLLSVVAGAGITLSVANQELTIASAAAAVSSVNGKTGTVVLTASDLNLATVASTGSYTDLTNKPSPYTLPAATTTTLGGIIVGGGLAVTANGTLSVTTTYTLPAATTSVLGGVIVGSGLSVSASGVVQADVTSVAGRTGAVTLAFADVGLPSDFLTSSNTVQTQYLPPSLVGAVVYQGTFDATTSTVPAAASTNKGWYYVVNVAGSYTPPGQTAISLSVGDWLISDGTQWSKISTQSAVSSVNGKVGTVVLTATDIGLGNVKDVDQTNASNLTSGLVGVGLLPGMGASGTNHQAGIVPDPGATAGTTRYLREDATWDVPPGSSYVLPQATTTTLGGVIVGSGLSVTAGTVSANVLSVAGRTGAVTLSASDVGLANVKNVDQTNASNLTSGTVSVALVPIMVASGTGHSAGLVPDPGAVAGTSRYLREDGTWDVPPGSTYTLPAATATTLGGVIIPANSGLTVTVAGDLSANVLSVAGRTGAVTLTATDVSGVATTGANTFTGTQTFAYQTLKEPLLSGYAETFNPLGNVSGTLSLDLSTYGAFSFTQTAASTVGFTNIPASGRFAGAILMISNGGNFTLTWPTGTVWAGGTAPTLTTSGLDHIALVTTNGGTTWYGYVLALNI